MPEISPQAIGPILRFVDEMVPRGCTQVWLTGSRAKGSARPDSDWDVVAFHPDASRDPKDIFIKGTQVREHPLGGQIELVIAYPLHWDGEGRYMSDLRAFGIRLR